MDSNALKPVADVEHPHGPNTVAGRSAVAHVRSSVASPKRAVVIGTGFGGLAIAIRLRLLGFHVQVLEALHTAGGRARVFEQDGFTFDAGPTVITAPYLLEELFSLAGRDMSDYVELMAVDPFYRVRFEDGSSFDYFGDEQRMLAQIAQFEPRDVDGYLRLARRAEEIFDVGYTQLADQPFDRLSDMLRVVPAMMRLESFRTVHQLVARYISDERLRRVFTFEPLLVGGNPFQASSIYLLIHWLERKWGVHFARGGTGAIVAALVRLLAELDVQVRFASPVESIDVRDGRVTGVRTLGGERIAADVVVSNADPSYTYTHMISAAARKRHTDRRVARVRQSMSLFVGYFGASRQYPDLAHHTILLGDRYEALLDDVFRRRVLADDFSLYLHAPTRSDPALAPKGSEAFYVLSPVPNNRSGLDWPLIADDYFDRILARLESTVLPGIRDSITCRFTMTPYDFEHTLRSVDGAAFGPEPILTQSAWFRYHNRSEDIDGLYFVGAGTHPGAGVPGVLSSARVVERLIAERMALTAQ
ncbi:MAG: phytoene desaturase [Gemmatimonadota bacterium]|nr:phytoene desaturase [Gemmatimonadota bacterium]